MPKPTMTPERLWATTVKSGECWLWTGKVSNKGYGKLKYKNRDDLAHRLSYMFANGPIPAGLELDHVRARGCTSTLCINPAHLEAVTHAENMRRSPFAAFARNARKTHCPRGHAYTPENTWVQIRGQVKMRKCKACSDARRYAHRAERAAAQRAYTARKRVAS